MKKIASQRVAVDDDNKNSLELVFLFDDAAIDSGPSDAVTVEPAHCQQFACLIVNLPIVSRPFGGDIIIDVGSHRTLNLSLDHPWIERDKFDRVRFRSGNAFPRRAMITRRSFLGSNVAEKQQRGDDAQDNEMRLIPAFHSFLLAP